MSDGVWLRQGCYTPRRSFVCKLPAENKIRSKETVFLDFQKGDLIANQFSVMYTYETDCNPRRINNRTTGFKMSWHMKDGNGIRGGIKTNVFFYGKTPKN